MNRTMVALRARSKTAVSVGVAAALVVVSPVAAVASETPPATPEATPEAVSATPETTDEPLEPIGTPKTNEFSLGQSLQMRVGPDAKPNSNLANFRWSVNQLTVQGQEDGVAEVPVPDRGAIIRSLLDFSKPAQTDGVATLTPEVANGSGVARTVSLFPQDEEPPIALEASFTLDGEPIEAWEVVGKSGALTATYKLINQSTTDIEVEVENLAGKKVKKTVEADVPMIGIGKMLIPQRFNGLKLKGGTFGADGRGNNQVQFIALPFRPLSKDGSATFGWAANVEDATLPNMVLQVAPVYIPEDDPNTPEDEAAGGGAGIPAPNLDPAVAEIQAGVAQLIEGLNGFAAAGGGPDPLDQAEAALNKFFSTFGQNIEAVATTIDPNAPESVTSVLVKLQGALTTIQEDDLLTKLDSAANLLTPERAGVLASAADPIKAVADNADAIIAVADNAAAIQQLADLAPQIQAAVDGWGTRDEFVADCTPVLEEQGVPLPAQVCRTIYNRYIEPNYAALVQVAAILNTPEFQTAAQVVNSPQFRQLADLVANEQFEQAAVILQEVGPQLVPLSNALQVANRQLPGAITVLTPLVGTLVPALNGLSNQLEIIGGGLEEANLDLPTLDTVISSVVSQILNSPPGQNVTGGLGQVSAGVGDATAILGNYLTQVIVTLKGVGQKAGAVAGDVDAAVVTVKAEVAGLLQAAHTSPLPYGGDPAQAPADTVLAGAFEFRVDAADNNQPTTGTRILIGLVALLGAGALSYFVGRRKGEESSVVEPALVGAGVGSVAAGAASGSVEADAPGFVVPDVDDRLTAEVPGVDVPDLDVPEADLPDLDVTDVETPDVDMADIDLPEGDLPEVDLPEAELPDVDLSDADRPEVDLPDVDVPDVDGPDGNLRDIIDPDGDGRPGA